MYGEMKPTVLNLSMTNILHMIFNEHTLTGELG